MGVEIERKWLMDPQTVEQITGLLKLSHSAKIEQGYLCSEPVVRVRRDGDEYYMTYKGHGHLKREEYNLPLTKDAYEHLSKKCDGILVEKTRYMVPIGKLSADSGEQMAELDIFHGAYEGLVYVEVEFQTVEEAKAFQPPSWFGIDVTELGFCSNSWLSRHDMEALRNALFTRGIVI